MMNKYLALILSLCLFACGEGPMIKNVSSTRIEKAINICMNEYSRLSGRTFFSEVDRAYVHVSSEQLGIIFAHGEVGSFGARSKSYRSYLSCGVSTLSEIKIYSLEEPFQKPLINLEGSDEIYNEFYHGNVKELFYKLKKGRFVFIASQALKVNREVF